MSTRYVWGKYDVKIEYTDIITDGTKFQLHIGDAVTHLSVGTGYSGDGINLKLIGEDKTSYLSIIGQDAGATGYPATTWKFAKQSNNANIIFSAKDPKPTDHWIVTSRPSSPNYMNLFLGDYSCGVTPLPSGSIIQELFRKPTGESSGTFIGNVSASSSSTYPSNGKYNSFWYKYLGSDNIDPTSVSYSKQKIESGDLISVTVTPKTPTYGGTVYYQFSYSLDGGFSWTTIGSKTTSTSVSITVPATANQFQARAIASDNLGFTSSSHVYGENLILNVAPSPPTYVSIPETVYTGSEFSVNWGASVAPDGNLAGYDIERAFDGSQNWGPVQTDVAGLSITDIILEEHLSVQYRVRGKDSHGLLSSWTTSNVAVVSKLKAYIGIDNKSKAIAKIYVGVNDKAHEILKGYIGVDGKARKFL